MPNVIIPPWDDKAPLLPNHTDDNRPCVSIPGGRIIGDHQSIIDLIQLATSPNEFKNLCHSKGFIFEPNEDV